MRLIAISALTLAVSTASALEAPAQQQDPLEECGALSQAGMRTCLARKVDASETALKRAEERARAGLIAWDEDAPHIRAAQERLERASKAFLGYRESQCAFEAALGGGAIGNALDLRRLACIIKLNHARAEELSTSIGALPPR